MKNSGARERFFLVFAWIIFFFVVTSFGAKAVFDTADLPPLTYLHHLHALTMLAWFALFAAQPTLVHLGRTDTHRLLGRLSPLVVLLFVSFALPIARLNWERTGDVLIITANSVNMVLFVGLYCAALACRRRAAVHKRLMVYAALMLIGPPAGRIPEIFDQTPLLAVPIVFVFLAAPLVHDIVVHRRVHFATWIGFLVAVAAIPLILGLSGSGLWAGWLEGVLAA